MAVRKIVIQATGFGTGAGKSFVVALLSRLFSEDGYKVAPYKTLNLTPVTYIKHGKEFGYAQALQAIAAGQEPDYREQSRLLLEGIVVRIKETFKSKGFFPVDRPARTAVVTGLIRPDMLVEMECIAYKPLVESLS